MFFQISHLLFCSGIFLTKNQILGLRDIIGSDLILNIYIFIYLAVLGLSCGRVGSSMFVEACRIFSCSVWDLVP